jgi:hypothetical protein
VLVAVDILGALAEKPLGFPYLPLGVVSLLVYLSVGLYGAWRSGLLVGVLGAATVGLLDGTLRPLAGWLVGPGPIGRTVTEPRIFTYSIAVVTSAAAFAGVLGALAGFWLERRRSYRDATGIVPR